MLLPDGKILFLGIGHYPADTMAEMAKMADQLMNDPKRKMGFSSFSVDRVIDARNYPAIEVSRGTE